MKQNDCIFAIAVEEYGVQIINDVSEGLDAEMFDEVGRLGVSYILMSVEPTMQRMVERFRTEVARLEAAGCKDIILDPGFGFGKDVIGGNYDILLGMDELKKQFPALPLLVGVSRKRMVWMPLGVTPDSEAAMQGTMLVNLMALRQGADILRVHDVKETATMMSLCE